MLSKLQMWGVSFSAARTIVHCSPLGTNQLLSLPAMTGQLAHHVGKQMCSVRPGAETTAPNCPGFEPSF